MIRTFTRAWRIQSSIPRRVRSTLQWVARCPEPTCGCQATPPDLDIDHDSRMTFSFYREHLLVCTGQNDWASKIELDTSTGPLTRHLKSLLGPPGKRGVKAAVGGVVPGKYHNPYSPHMITNASFLSSADREFHSSTSHLLSPKDELPTKPTSLYLFPSFKYVTLPVASDSALYNSSLDALIQNYVHPSMLETNPLQEEKDIILQQRSEHDKDHVDLRPQPVHEVVVLICGHGGRDSRCGALGLPLQHEFEDKLRRASINVLPHCRPSEEVLSSKAARVGLISHIGGHKWAGNVIIYIPPRWREQEGHSLSGSAIWYGRVEPKHVEGIVKETVLGGRIVGELWRGGMQLSKTKEGLAWTSIPRPAS